MLIKVLYALLLVSVVALLGTAVACYRRVRRHMQASDDHLREVLEEFQTEGEQSKVLK